MKKIIILLFLLFGFTHLNQSVAQNKKSGSKTTTKKKKLSESAPITNDEETFHGHKVITGPRGGKYYINSKGNKTYIKH